MNQEAYGGPISENTYNNFHQYLPDFIMNQMTIDGVMFHPTFLYESFWNIVVFIFLLVLRRYNPLRGEVFLSYVLTISLGGFLVEVLGPIVFFFVEFGVDHLFSILLFF